MSVFVGLWNSTMGENVLANWLLLVDTELSEG